MLWLLSLSPPPSTFARKLLCAMAAPSLLLMMARSTFEAVLSMLVVSPC